MYQHFEKKGTMKLALLLIPACLILAFMAILMRAYFVPKLHQIEVQPNIELMYEQHTERMLNECFVYRDEKLKRDYPGIIDAKLVTQEKLENCFSGKKPFAGIKIRTLDTQKGLTLGESNPVRRITYSLLYQDGQKHPAELTLYLLS